MTAVALALQPDFRATGEPVMSTPTALVMLLVQIESESGICLPDPSPKRLHDCWGPSVVLHSDRHRRSSVSDRCAVQRTEPSSRPVSSMHDLSQHRRDIPMLPRTRAAVPTRTAPRPVWRQGR